jgi:hypothetical protein
MTITPVTHERHRHSQHERRCGIPHFVQPSVSSLSKLWENLINIQANARFSAICMRFSKNLENIISNQNEMLKRLSVIDKFYIQSIIIPSGLLQP